jgi:hypothetical protein
VHVVTPEDLILMKIISERPRDAADAEAIVRRRIGELDPPPASALRVTARQAAMGCCPQPPAPSPESRHDRPLCQRAQPEEICGFDDDRILDRQRP